MALGKNTKIPSSDTMAVTEALLGGVFWDNIRIEYDGSNNPIYVGLNPSKDAAEGDTTWHIVKINYTSNNPDEIQRRYGSWTGRAAIGWTI